MHVSKPILALLAGAMLMPGCAPWRLNEADPIPQLARDQHGQYLKSDLGFGVDASRPYFYESFETFQSGTWEAVQTGTATTGDRWQAADAQAKFGSRSLTYGQSEVVANEVTFDKAFLTAKEAVSLVSAKKPVLIVFCGFLLTGQEGDKTAVRIEASPDLGFTWTPLAPTGTASSSLEGPIKKPADTASLWKRYEYSLASFTGGTVRLRIALEATANSRKLVFVDDLLVAEK